MFAKKGFVAATTGDIARAAGVSQPYVIHLFGNKNALVADVVGYAIQRVVDAFEAAIDADAPDELPAHIGAAYLRLFREEEGLLLCLAHAFTAGADPTIGPLAREGFLRVYRTLVDQGRLSPEQAGQVLAAGMLSNVILGLQLPREYDDNQMVRDLLAAVYPGNIELFKSASAPRE